MLSINGKMTGRGEHILNATVLGKTVEPAVGDRKARHSMQLIWMGGQHDVMFFGDDAPQRLAAAPEVGAQIDCLNSPREYVDREGKARSMDNWTFHPAGTVQVSVNVAAKPGATAPVGSPRVS